MKTMGLRLAVIGAGPIGLEAATRAACDGYDVTVYERGDVAAGMRGWGHVRLFSPFSMNSSPLGIDIIRRNGGGSKLPDRDACLTGSGHFEAYLNPLALAVSRICHLSPWTKVAAVGREGLLKHERIGQRLRCDSPFRLLLQNADGAQRVEHADLVIDASGIYDRHNWMGDGGIPAAGESAAGDFMSYGVDDIARRDRARYAGKRVLLVGAGHSAATAVIALDLLRVETGTRLVWLTRSSRRPPVVELECDPLPERKSVAAQANALALNPPEGVEHHPGTAIDAIEVRGSSVGVTLRTVGGATRTIEVDRIIANVGYQPDRSIYRELQVHECYATQGPIKLAARLLGEGSADCLNQPAYGADALSNPEPGFFILGAKSYGRSPGFLMRAGIGQVGHVFNSLSGRP